MDDANADNVYRATEKAQGLALLQRVNGLILWTTFSLSLMVLLADFLFFLSDPKHRIEMGASLVEIGSPRSL